MFIIIISQEHVLLNNVHITSHGQKETPPFFVLFLIIGGFFFSFFLTKSAKSQVTPSSGLSTPCPPPPFCSAVPWQLRPVSCEMESGFLESRGSVPTGIRRACAASTAGGRKVTEGLRNQEPGSSREEPPGVDGEPTMEAGDPRLGRLGGK